jgi:hypothetical protein
MPDSQRPKPKNPETRPRLQRDPAEPRHVMAVTPKEPNPDLARCMRCQAIIRSTSRYCRRHEPAQTKP